MSLVDKIRKAREVAVEAGGHSFTIRRPTDEEMLRLSNEDGDMFGIVRAHTVGWNLKELDLIPGGGPEPVAFTAELFSEWIGDQPETWHPLGEAILEAYKAHADKRSTAVKN